MALFGKRKAEPAAVRDQGAETISVQVLGGGCASCNALEAAAAAALSSLGLSPAVGHIRDYGEIAALGVMRLPALMVNGRVVSSGRVLKQREIAALLQEELGKG